MDMKAQFAYSQPIGCICISIRRSSASFSNSSTLGERDWLKRTRTSSDKKSLHFRRTRGRRQNCCVLSKTIYVTSRILYRFERRKTSCVHAQDDPNGRRHSPLSWMGIDNWTPRRSLTPREIPHSNARNVECDIDPDEISHVLLPFVLCPYFLDFSSIRPLALLADVHFIWK